MTDSGVIIIYCPAYKSPDRGILKIDTNTDTVTELEANPLPEGWCNWRSCALAVDGSLYFMPCRANRIMKLDPSNNDAMSIVGDDFGNKVDEWHGIVVGIDRCVYVMPYYSKRIVKYDPINDITSFVGERADTYFYGCGGGILGRDGCIYAPVRCGRVLKINTTNNSHCIAGNTIETVDRTYRWGGGTLGIDGCIYWPPTKARHVLKFDPHSNLTSLVKCDLGIQPYKWRGRCAAPNGVIYCLPSNATRILAIDPLKEYALSLKNNMEEHPEKLGCLFHPSDDIPNDTIFDRAVTKFDQRKVLELLEECISLLHQFCTASNLYPLRIVASCENSNVSVIYHYLLRGGVPSYMNYIDHASHSDSNLLL